MSSWQARITRRWVPSLISWSAPVNETEPAIRIKWIVIIINVLYTFATLSKIFELNILDILNIFNCSKFIYLKTYIFKRINGIFYAHYKPWTRF